MADSDEVIFKRTILFLKSDAEYRWIHPSMIEKIKVYLFKMFRLKSDIQTNEKVFEGDENYWPFFSMKEYKKALDQPKYLTKW